MKIIILIVFSLTIHFSASAQEHDMSMPKESVKEKKLDPQRLITHRFKLDQIIKAYDTFEHAAKEKALKIILMN